MDRRPHPACVAVVVAAAAASLLGLLSLGLEPQKEGCIVFQSDRDGNWQIYSMDAQGRRQTRLTHTTAEEWLPKWSADGSHLAFVSNRDGDWALYAWEMGNACDVNTAGDIKRLTDYPGNDWDPSWSPDGTQMAFSSLRDGNWEIYVLNLDTGKAENLTNHPADDWLPAWSPDGQHIAFVSDRDGNWEIYVMHANGNQPLNLTRHPADDWIPAWSPDGRRIAFQSNRDDNWEIYVMDRDGTRLQNLTDCPANDWDPAWSPEGLHIVFMSERDGNRELYTLNANHGRGLTRLTYHPTADKNPSWSQLQSKGMDQPMPRR